MRGTQTFLPFALTSYLSQTGTSLSRLACLGVEKSTVAGT